MVGLLRGTGISSFSFSSPGGFPAVPRKEAEIRNKERVGSKQQKGS